MKTLPCLADLARRNRGENPDDDDQIIRDRATRQFADYLKRLGERTCS